MAHASSVDTYFSINGYPVLNMAFSSIASGLSFPPTPARREAYVVGFDGPPDPWDPKNWRSSRKLLISIIACYGTFVATFNSALFAPGAAEASKEFGVGEEVGKLGTSLFVLGFATGPLIWAPGSELIGRRWPLVVAMFGSSVFSLGSATAKDIQTLIICRFFAGVFGAGPLSVVPAVLSDLYNDVHRRTAISIYALTVFIGPLAAPFVGAFISDSYLGWRWTSFLPAIMGFSDAALLLFPTQETFGSVVLVGKASQIRRETGNWAIHADHERLELDGREVARKYITRPLRMLVTEPTVLLVSLYMSFVYGLVYGLLGAYPFVFEDVYGMKGGVASLPFIGLIIGVTLAVVFIIWQQSRTAQQAAARGEAVIPETLLVPPMVGAPAFAMGLFWFAWTSFTPSIHWIVPTASGVLTAFGLLCIFLPCFNYLVDAYLPLAASAVAANVMLRSGIATGFPMFSVQMFRNLGTQWAGTTLGCIATVMIPIPFIFRAYGGRLRARSRLLNESVVQSHFEAKEGDP